MVNSKFKNEEIQHVICVYKQINENKSLTLKQNLVPLFRNKFPESTASYAQLISLVRRNNIKNKQTDQTPVTSALSIKQKDFVLECEKKIRDKS